MHMNGSLLVPQQDLETEFKEAYEWLARALIQYCDEVECGMDHDGNFTVAAVWRKGSLKNRVGLAVDTAEKSLNRSINDGELTKNEAIRLFTKRRPAWR